MTAATIGVVFDCNVFLQAAARDNSPAAACLRLAENGYIRLYASKEVLKEVEDVLNRPEIRALFDSLTDETVTKFIEHLQDVAEVVRNVPRKFSYQRDVDDELYINLAVEIEADYIVSRDKDLLDLMTGYTDECKEFRQRFRPLKVIDPVDFLRVLKEAQHTGDEA